MTNQQKLFTDAVGLFGDTSFTHIPNALQNPGSLKTQDDIEDIFQKALTELDIKEEILRGWKMKVREWQERLKTAFIDGTLDQEEKHD